MSEPVDRISRDPRFLTGYLTGLSTRQSRKLTEDDQKMLVAAGEVIMELHLHRAVAEDRKMRSLLLALLDRIEVEEDHTLARQRFDIAEQCGLTVDIDTMQISGAQH